MAQRVRYIQSFTVSAEIEIARVRAIEVRYTCRFFADWSKERTGVNPEYMDRVFETICDVESGTVCIEQRLLAIETGFKIADYRIRCSVDHATEVCILIENDGVLDRIDTVIEGRNANANRSKASSNSTWSKVNPLRHATA